MTIKVWDIPTRLFHWLLVSACIGAFFTSRNEWFLEHHAAAGYIALGLIVFRVMWGFAGNRHARFSEFLKGWKEVKVCASEMMSRKPQRELGHNPVVGWAVVLMLGLTAAISVTGVIVYSGEEVRGVLAGFFSFEAAQVARVAHQFLANLAIAVAIGHVCAALFHDLILKENLIITMFTGKKEDEVSWRERVSNMKPEEGLTRQRFAVWVAVTVLCGLGLVYLPPEGKTDFSGQNTSNNSNGARFAALAAGSTNPAWKAECANSCHAGFHPSLLPADSWSKVLASLDNHFGDNASLDANTLKEVQDYLTRYSAEHAVTEASRKISYSIPKGATPIAVTETPYWKTKHADISNTVFKRKSVSNKSNCLACHPGAEVGSFEDRDIRIPA